jgi:hypothetical protein
MARIQTFELFDAFANDFKTADLWDSIEPQHCEQLDVNKASRIPGTIGESIVYVDYLQSAPWNGKRKWRPNRQFGGLGTLMLQVAIQLSLELELEVDFDGRVGLHSLSQSEDFYRSRQLTEFWRDPDYQGLCYFEMTLSQAANLLNNGGE